MSGPPAASRFRGGFRPGGRTLCRRPVAYPERVLVASATIDGHAAALRLKRADTLTLRCWVDARPVKDAMDRSNRPPCAACACHSQASHRPFPDQVTRSDIRQGHVELGYMPTYSRFQASGHCDSRAEHTSASTRNWHWERRCGIPRSEQPRRIPRWNSYRLRSARCSSPRPRGFRCPAARHGHRPRHHLP